MARRFRFRLEGLLKLRKSLEEEAQRHLARMTELRNEAQATLEALRTERAAVADSRRSEVGQVLDLDRWRAIERYLVVMEHRIAAAAEALEEAVQRVQEAVQALQRAHRAHLTLLRLKERRQDLHLAEIQREEMAALDEMAVLRHRFKPVTGTLGAREVPS